MPIGFRVLRIQKWSSGWDIDGRRKPLVSWCPSWVSRWPVPGVRISVDLLLSGQAEQRRPPVITGPSRRADMWPSALPIIIMENKFQIKSELCKYRDNILHHRGPSWPRWLLASVGVILVSAVIVCVLTLVTSSHLDTRDDVSRTLSDQSRGILLKRLQSATVRSSRRIGQEDIFISVKTSAQFHGSRLQVILGTWFQLARRNTFFFTDQEDKKTSLLTGGHLVVTPCPSDHSRQALSCKMQAEFDAFLDTDKRWEKEIQNKKGLNWSQLCHSEQTLTEQLLTYLGYWFLIDSFVTIDVSKEEICSIFLWIDFFLPQLFLWELFWSSALITR